jgi:hypothetical protein
LYEDKFVKKCDILFSPRSFVKLRSAARGVSFLKKRETGAITKGQLNLLSASGHIFMMSKSLTKISAKVSVKS